MRDWRFSALRWSSLLLTVLAISTIPPGPAPARTAPHPLPPREEAGGGKYREIGKLPRPEACEGTIPYASFRYISPDGNTVAGTISVNIGVPGHGHWLDHAFVWTQRDGLRDLGELLDKTHTSRVNAVAADGSTVAGSTADSTQEWAFVWQRGVGINQNIPRAQTQIAHPVFQHLKIVTPEGNYVIGQDAGVLFRWSREEGTKPLGEVPPDMDVYALTRDAHAIAGMTNCEACLWTPNEGLLRLGILRRTPGSVAYGISDDGQVVVGTSGNHLFRWTRRSGMEDLGLLPGRQEVPMPRGPLTRTVGGELGPPFSVSRDGNVIFGFSRDDYFVWTRRDGFRMLKDILAASGKAAITDRYREIATLSADGRTIWGISRDSRGALYRWRLDVRDKD
jgi:probable HAF family extracellular repeat protein